MELVRTEIPYVYILGLVLAAFATLGFKRGWVREGATFGGVILAWSISARLGDAILQFLNRTTRSILFVVQGGIESSDPARLVRSLNETQLADLQRPQIPLAIMFGILVIIAYVLTNRFLQRQRPIPGKIGGSLIAMLNGFLIAFVMLQAPSLQSKMVLSVSLPTKEGTAIAEQYTPGVLVAVVGVIIAFALFTSIRTARRRVGAGWAEKRRS